MKRYIILFFIVLFGISVMAQDLSDNKNIETISNKFISISMPKDTKGLYSIKKKYNGIFIYDKVSKKGGFGGFAFGIQIYKNPKEHATMPGSKKLGELVDKKGIIYDVVLIQPTDVQYDYVNQKSTSYDKLYYLADTIDTTIKGVRGNQYFNQQGMLGKDLYKDILKKHVKAIDEKWDSTKLEKEKMSYMYNVLSANNNNVKDKVGYAYYDVNVDGIEELFIGEISEGQWKGVIYDIYTMVDRKPKHVASGGNRNRYFVCDNFFLCNEYSAGAGENGWLVYILIENSTELFPQVGFKYDEYDEKSKTPYFITYDINSKKWENVSKQFFYKRKEIFDSYIRFNYIPLNTVK